MKYKHSYIDKDKVRDFSKPKTLDDIYDDFEKYNIQNVLDDGGFGEYLFYLCNALLDDYNYGRANYEAYIEKDMDARILMELRKSAVLVFGKDLTDFYEENGNCETVEEIRALRTKYVKHACEEYEDENWQYYYLVKINRSKKEFTDFQFDYEGCFEDGDWRKETRVEDYIEHFNYIHSIEGIKEQIRKECGRLNSDPIDME